jgi:hypothetical protein
MKGIGCKEPVSTVHGNENFFQDRGNLAYVAAPDNTQAYDDSVHHLVLSTAP